MLSQETNQAYDQNGKHVEEERRQEIYVDRQLFPEVIIWRRNRSSVPLSAERWLSFCLQVFMSIIILRR